MTSAHERSEKEFSRLDALFRDGDRKMTRAELSRLLGFQYPRLHEVMFKPLDTARDRRFAKRYRAKVLEWRERGPATSS